MAHRDDSVEQREGQGVNWAGFWTRLTVIVLAVSVGVSVYSTARLWTDIRQRRALNCRNTNADHQNQLNFWNGILALSAQTEKEAYVVIGEKRYRVVFEEPERPRRIAEFEELKEKAFPITKCGPGGSILPTTPPSTEKP